MVPDFTNPQAFNRYSYVENNPLKYTDEDGRNPAVVIVPVAIIFLLKFLLLPLHTVSSTYMNPLLNLELSKERLKRQKTERRQNSNGSQTWAQVRNGKIINGGINDTPKIYTPETGLNVAK